MAGHRLVSLRMAAPGSPAQTAVSISDMDMRALTSLYIPGGGYAPSRTSVNRDRSARLDSELAH